jgi:hypothetical protein
MLKQTGIVVKGVATLSLWGGGIGCVEIKPCFLPFKKATKDNILRCVNDNGFGCQFIERAEIDIYDQYENGYMEYNRTLFADHPVHTMLFLGWRELREQGINC